MTDVEARPFQRHSPNVGVAAAAAAGLSAVPYVGGPIATLLMERWARMSQRNVAEYVQGIEHDLEELAYDVAMLEAPMADPQVQEVGVQPSMDLGVVPFAREDRFGHGE